MSFITNDSFIHFDQNNPPQFHITILDQLSFNNVSWQAGDLSKSSQGIIRSNDIAGAFNISNLYFNYLDLPPCNLKYKFNEFQFNKIHILLDLLTIFKMPP